MGRDRARRVAHASPVEQPWSAAALLAGLGFVASPITQYAAAGGRELSETLNSVNAYHKGAIDERRTRRSWCRQARAAALVTRAAVTDARLAFE